MIEGGVGFSTAMLILIEFIILIYCKAGSALLVTDFRYLGVFDQ